MLPKRICGIIKRLSMISTFSERYYGQTPCSATIVQYPSPRTPAALRNGAPCQGPAPCPDGFTRPSRPFRGRDCGHCLPQPRYNRFLRGGVAAISPRKAPGRAPTVTLAWKAELLRVIDLDPHTVGVHSANWTTGLLALYLAAKT